MVWGGGGDHALGSERSTRNNRLCDGRTHAADSGIELSFRQRHSTFFRCQLLDPIQTSGLNELFDFIVTIEDVAREASSRLAPITHSFSPWVRVPAYLVLSVV